MKKSVMVLIIVLMFPLLSIQAASNTNTDTKIKNLPKVLRVIDTVHAVLGGVAYTGFGANIGVGSSLLYGAYTNPDYYRDPLIQNLKLAHKLLMVPSYILYGGNAILSFVSFGLRVYHKLPVNLPHFVLAMITTVFYLFEIVSMGISKWAFDNQVSYAKSIAIAHGVLSSVMMTSYTLTIIALPVGQPYKKVLSK